MGAGLANKGAARGTVRIRLRGDAGMRKVDEFLISIGKWAILLGLAILLASLGGCGWQLYKSVFIERIGVKTTAVVVEARSEAYYDENDVLKFDRSAVIRYEADGEVYEKQISTTLPYKEGSKLTIYYLPSNPYDTGEMSVVVSAICVVGFIVGLSVMILPISRKKRSDVSVFGFSDDGDSP
jgi:hypothetical protein